MTTMDQLLEMAPSLAPLSKAAIKRGLLDTHSIMTWLGEKPDLGMRVVLATQGPVHRDAPRGAARHGRHLLVMSNDELVFAMVNGHYMDRRVYAGLGVSLGAGNFMLFPVITLQRWKPWQEPLCELLEHAANIRKVDRAARRLVPSDRERSDFAKGAARMAYLGTTASRPAYTELMGGDDLTLHGVAAFAMAMMRRGNLKGRHHAPRRVKGVSRPDALFHMGAALGELVRQRTLPDLRFGPPCAVRP